MASQSSQLSLADIFTECQDLLYFDKPAFFVLLEKHIDLDLLIPSDFYHAFNRKFGRHRKYPLYGFISSLILQKILTIPTDSLLIILLHLCKELRVFCGFDKIPDASKFTRFKQDFLPYLEQLFTHLVDYTEPICQAIDPVLASTITFDTTGIEVYVTENNPKTLNALIKRLKSTYKNNPTVDPHKMAYGLMPSTAEASPSAKQMYINGHFCYAHKLSLVTNGLGIIRHIAFLDDDFKQDHPELVIEKKSDSPEQDKTIADSSALQPVLTDFFSLHPAFKPHTFLGDAAFDTIETYSFLKESCHFSKVLIPWNPRNQSNLPPVGFNAYGYPLCPADDSLPMKRIGLCHEKGRSDRIKWGCPKIHKAKGLIVCDCESPCSSAKFGRTTYTYDHQDFRMFPGIQRDSDQWKNLYKIRGNIERAINHFKINMCIADRKTRNVLTTKADTFFAGIATLLTLILASRIEKPQYIRSLKPLIA